jgi:hypothetical protein
MALVLADRVLEITTTAGSGTITLAGAKTGYQSFSVVGNGNTTYYTITGGAEWEVGIGTYTSSGTTLSRDTVLASSSGGAKVTFSAGTKDVFVTYPAGRAVYGNTTAAPTNGQLLIGNGTGYTLSTLSAGSGISITNSAGSITLATSGGGLPTINVTSSTSISAVANNHYVLTSTTAATLTLPASPTSGDVVWTTVANGLTTNVIARNGQKINEVAEDMTIDSAYAGIQLRYANSTEGWVFT